MSRMEERGIPALLENYFAEFGDLSLQVRSENVEPGHFALLFGESPVSSPVAKPIIQYDEQRTPIRLGLA